MKILSVDDDDASQRLIQNSLVPDFEVICAMSGEQAISNTHAISPDIILLDVNMPGKNGFETCTELRQTYSSTDIPILFISAEGELNHRLKGYQSGGDDFIVKPFDIEELKSKILTLANFSQQSKSIKNNCEQFRSAMMTALTNSSEIGEVLRFIKNTFEADSNHALAELIIDFCESYNLRCSLQIRSNGLCENFSCRGEPSALERDILFQAQHAERIISSGNNTLFNSPQISLLIKHMPIDNEELYGRLKDHLAMILDGAIACLNRLELATSQQQKRQSTIAKIDQLIRENIEPVAHYIQDCKSAITEKLDDVDVDIQSTLTDIELSAEQHQSVLGLFEELRKHTLSALETSECLEQEIARLTLALSELKTQ